MESTEIPAGIAGIKITVNPHASGCSAMHKSLGIYYEFCTQTVKGMRFGAQLFRDFRAGEHENTLWFPMAGYRII